MSLPSPPDRWSVTYQSELNRALEELDRNNRKRNSDVFLTRDRLILVSPDGTKFAVTVDDAGALDTTEVP